MDIHRIFIGMDGRNLHESWGVTKQPIIHRDIFYGYSGGFSMTGWWLSHLPLWEMMDLKSVGMKTFPTEWKNKKCSKPPTRLFQWPFQDPKLEVPTVPTICKAYLSGLCKGISHKIWPEKWY